MQFEMKERDRNLVGYLNFGKYVPRYEAAMLLIRKNTVDEPLVFFCLKHIKFENF